MNKSILGELANQLLSRVTDTLEKGGDPTNGGKLFPVHIVDKNGHHTTRYKSMEEITAMHSSGEFAHVEPIKVGHRFTHAKHGTGFITKIKGHDGKGGHEMNVAFDNGKKSTAYIHNLQMHNPLELDDEKQSLPDTKSDNPYKTKGDSKKEKVEEDPDHDDFDETMLTPKERMKEWERMIYRLTKPGAGVNAAIAYGKGGVGKTYRAMKMLTGLKNADGEQMEEGRDYVSFTGGTTAAALYETLYNNNGKLILLDDFDDVFKNEDCVNMLKGACDTSAKRPITSAKSENPDNPSPYPNRFLFTGKIAFISNLNLDHLADKSPDIEALLSRADSMNLRMTNSQTVDLIKSDIINSKGFSFRRADGKALHVTQEEKDEVMDFVDEHKHGLSELSVRTLGKINAMRMFYEKKGKSWKDKGTAMLVKGRQDDLDVNERFDTYGDFVEILAKGGVKSVIAYGRGGIGKTYTAISKLNELGMQDIDGVDDPESSDMEQRENEFIHMSGGKFTAKGLYESLFKNNGRLIVIDDADTALLNSQAQAILKGALDTSGSGKVNWLTSSSSKKAPKLPKKEKGESKEDYDARLIEDGHVDMEGNTIDKSVPNEFEFKGRVLFISNLPPDKIAQPLQSRALTINTTMTRDQAIERFKHVAKVKRANGAPASGNVTDATHDDVDAVIAHFESLKDKIPDRHFNNRTIDRMLADKVHADKFGTDDEGNSLDWKRTVKTKLLKGLDYRPLNTALVGFDPIGYKINLIQKGMGTSERRALGYFQKAEGSKGGHIIGHTTSGKPVYASTKTNHSATSGYSSQDHLEAGRLHNQAMGSATNNRNKAAKNKNQQQVNDYNAEINEHERNVKLHRAGANQVQKSMDSNIEAALNFFQKGGEGSKGGKIVGHTPSGKPIYASAKVKPQYSVHKHGDGVKLKVKTEKGEIHYHSDENMEGKEEAHGLMESATPGKDGVYKHAQVKRLFKEAQSVGEGKIEERKHEEGSDDGAPTSNRTRALAEKRLAESKPEQHYSPELKEKLKKLHNQSIKTNTEAAATHRAAGNHKEADYHDKQVQQSHDNLKKLG